MVSTDEKTDLMRTRRKENESDLDARNAFTWAKLR